MFYWYRSYVVTALFMLQCIVLHCSGRLRLNYGRELRSLPHVLVKLKSEFCFCV